MKAFDLAIVPSKSNFQQRAEKCTRCFGFDYKSYDNDEDFFGRGRSDRKTVSLDASE